MVMTLKQQDEYAQGIFNDCLVVARGDIEAATLAAGIILSVGPMPDEVDIEQEECDDDGNDPIPVDLVFGFNPNEPRDELGQWTTGGSVVGHKFKYRGKEWTVKKQREDGKYVATTEGGSSSAFDQAQLEGLAGRSVTKKPPSAAQSPPPAPPQPQPVAQNTSTRKVLFGSDIQDLDKMISNVSAVMEDLEEKGQDDSPMYNGLFFMHKALWRQQRIPLSKKKDHRSALSVNANGTLVAAGSMTRSPSGYAKIEDLGSIEKGAGKEVIDSLIKRAVSDWGAKEVVLDAAPVHGQDKLVKFYEGLGFVVTGEDTTGNGIPMKLTIGGSKPFSIDIALAVRHAPAGEPTVIAGETYKPGEFIPDFIWSKGTSEEQERYHKRGGKRHDTSKEAGTKQPKPITPKSTDKPPNEIYHTFNSGQGVNLVNDAGLFGITHDDQPNEYGDKVVKLVISKNAKVFTAEDQADAIKKLVSDKSNRDKLLRIYENGNPREVNKIDQVLSKALRNIGYDIIHYNKSEQYGEEWGIINPDVIESHTALSIDAFFAHDIFNRKAQGILNRSLQVAKGLSAAARKDLAAALKKGATGSGEAIINFIDKYRVQLARILTQTQIAAVLEGAKEVADKVPTLAEFPGAIPPPPTMEPQKAIKLVERLEKMEPDERAEDIYKLPAAEQAYVNQAIAARAAPPPVIPPIIPQRVGGGEPEDIHFPTIDEAVRGLAERNVMDRQKYDALEASARAKAFTVANVQAEETLTKIRDSLAANVEEGADYETWRKKVMEDVGQGTFMSDHHQETVFRTNVQAGLSDGQEAILSHPLVRSGFPYRARDAIHDGRVRDNHLALETLGIQGTNIYRADDPVWQMFRVPWDYNDRCADTPITVRHAAEKGIKEAQEWLETGVEPTEKAFVAMPDFRPPPGFQRAVAAAPLSIQMSLQPMATFSTTTTTKPEEETDTALLYGESEGWGAITGGALDTAKEGKPNKRMRVGRARTRKGRKVRRSLFKRLRVKRRWVPAASLAIEPPDNNKTERIELIARILVLLFGDKSLDVAKQLKSDKSITFSLDANGIFHGPTPPSQDGWVQIAPGPHGGKRWAKVESPYAAGTAPPESSSLPPHNPNYRAVANKAAKNILTKLDSGYQLTNEDKVSLIHHLPNMTSVNLQQLYNKLGGDGALTGKKVHQAHSVLAVLIGVSESDLPTVMPNEPIDTQTVEPEPKSEPKSATPGGVVPPETNIDELANAAGTLAKMSNVSVYKHPSTGETKLAIKVAKDSPEGKALAELGAGWSNQHQNYTISATKAVDVLKIMSPWPTESVVVSLPAIAKLGGSTGAELVEYNGVKYVRKMGATPGHVDAEYSADSTYQAVGMAVPRAKLFHTNAGMVKLAEYIPDAKTLSEYNKFATVSQKLKVKEELKRGFVMDALLGNWDVVGMGSDNVMVGADGKVWRIDNGGSFDYRAQGQKKTADQWNDKVADIDSMRDKSINPSAAAVYGDITDDQIREQVGGILSNKDKILSTVPNSQRKLISARIDQLAKRYPPPVQYKKGDKTLVTAVGGGESHKIKDITYTHSAEDASHVAFKSYADHEERTGFSKGSAPKSFIEHTAKTVADTPKVHISAVKRYTDGGYSSLNAAIQKCPHTLDCLDESDRKWVESMHKAIAAQGTLSTPINVWRKISVDNVEEYIGVFNSAKGIGATIQMPGIKSCSTKYNVWHGNIMFEIKARTGIYSAPFSNSSSEQEFTQGIGTKYKVLNVTKIDGQRTIQLEEVV